MTVFIEIVVGVAVVLIAGFLIVERRDRIRTLANATMLGVAAGAALPHSSDDSDADERHDHGSHPSESHWDGADSST